MKVGFFGVYRDMTGYGHTGLEIIKALHAAGLDVATRPISLTRAHEEIPDNDFYKELEAKPLHGVDVIIQSYLPEMMVRNGRCKNIGHFFCETTHFKPSNWQYPLNMMDSICVSSHMNQDAVEKSNVDKPVKIIPIPTNIEKYKDGPVLNLPGLDGKFVFYSIGDYSARKNYRQLITAYLSTFTRKDNVALVLKTFITGRTAEDSYNIITAEINNIKESLRLYDTNIYPPIILICDRLSENEMMDLHRCGDCFITMEHGSGWGLPAFDAMGFGKIIVAPDWGSHMEFLCGYNRFYSVKSHLDRCYGVTQAECPYRLYTGHEKWAYMHTGDIAASMRLVLNDYLDNIVLDIDTSYLNKFSYKEIGAQWKQYLEDVCSV